MNSELVKVSPIVSALSSEKESGYYAVIWVKDGVDYIEINGAKDVNAANSVIFLHPRTQWTIGKQEGTAASGYILYLDKEVLDGPELSKLHINQVRLFAENEIPKINLAPGIEKRINSLLEMLDELIGSNLNHKDEAIKSLLNTFFVYCDGQCNIKSNIDEQNSKKVIVYKFKRLVDKRVSECHEVTDYARMLNVSSAYLNECVKEVLRVNAKAIITEQRVMRSRHQLKFTDKSVKEICFDLGFSSPDYFSYFFKKHTGITPSSLRQG